MSITGKQLSGIILLGTGGGVMGAIVSVILFGVGCWVLYAFGFMTKIDAVLKVKVAVLACTALGFVLGVIRAVRMIH